MAESLHPEDTTTAKRYIAAHKHLLPAKRQQVAPQGKHGRRYMTDPGEAFQRILRRIS